MNKIKNIVFSALLTIGAFAAVTFTSCKSDDSPVDPCAAVVCQNGGACTNGTCSCPVGYTGANCETDVRTLYVGDYKGSGSDNAGGTYTNFTFTFSTSATGVTMMQVVAKNTSGTPFLTLPVTLTSNTTFTMPSTVVGNFTYSGSGTISSTAASIVITQTGNPNLVITFASLVKG